MLFTDYVEFTSFFRQYSFSLESESLSSYIEQTIIARFPNPTNVEETSELIKGLEKKFPSGFSNVLLAVVTNDVVANVLF